MARALPPFICSADKLEKNEEENPTTVSRRRRKEAGK